MSSLVRQFFRNITGVYAGTVVGLVVTFFFTPYLAGKLGTELYGIWTLVFSITKYMEMSDLGMRQSLVRAASMHYALRDWRKVNEVYSTTSMIYAGVFPVILLATVIVAFGFLDEFQIPPGQYDLARTTLLLIGFNTALHFLLLPSVSLGPLHRFDVGSYVSIGKIIVQALGMVLLLELGYGLVAMGLYVIAINVAEKATLYAARRRLFPEIVFARGLASWGQARELFSYSLISFLIILAIVVIHNTDNIVIGLFLSMHDVAVYSIPAMIVLQLRGLMGGLATVLVPTFSHLDSLKDKETIERLYARSTRYLYYLCSTLAVGAVLFGSAFLLLWMGPEFAEGGPVLHVLVIPACLMFPQLVAQSILLGISRHRLTLYVMMAEAAANIGLSLILVQKFGILGVAAGTAIPQLIIYSYVYPKVFLKEIRMSRRVFYREAVTSAAKGVAFVLPVGWAVRLLANPGHWPGLVIGVGACLVPIALGFYYGVMLDDDRARVLNWWRTRRRKTT